MTVALVPVRPQSTFRPNATIAVGVVTALAFALEAVLGHGDTTNPDVLLRMGASQHALVWEKHQFFRLLCPAFLHIGIVHILVNGYAYLQLAPFVERIWGASRFLIVYLLSALGGCFASSFFGTKISAGASGAVFGLIGFLIAAGWSGRQRHEVRKIIETYFGQGLVFWAGFNLWLGFRPGMHIDNLGHLGGLVTGLALGFVVTGVLTAPPRVRAVAALCTLAALASFVACTVFGASGVEALAEASPVPGRPRPRSNPAFDDASKRALEAYGKQDYAGCVLLCEQAIAADPKNEGVWWVLVEEGQAFLAQHKFDDSRTILERSFRVKAQSSTAETLAGVALLQGDTQGCLDWAERSAIAPGGSLGPLVRYADTFEGQKRLDLAIDALERAKRACAIVGAPFDPKLELRLEGLKAQVSK
jgi:rhomboid protease GluP